MRSYSAREKGRPRRSQVACDLVGVAGFEPAASSSRSQVPGLSWWAHPAADLVELSANVRRNPCWNAAIVTQWVTQALLGSVSGP